MSRHELAIMVSASILSEVHGRLSKLARQPPNAFLSSNLFSLEHTDPWLSQGAWWSAYRFMHFC